MLLLKGGRPGYIRLPTTMLHKAKAVVGKAELNHREAKAQWSMRLRAGGNRSRLPRTAALRGIVIMTLAAGAWLSAVQSAGQTPAASKAFAPGSAISIEIAKMSVQAIYSEVNLFITLSLAICGGLLVLMGSTVVHNNDHGKRRIEFQLPVLLVIAFILQVLSACLGLGCVGALTDAVPAIFGARYQSNSSLYETDFAGRIEVATTGKYQVLLFALSLLAMVLFIIANWSLLRSKKERIKPCKPAEGEEIGPQWL